MTDRSELHYSNTPDTPLSAGEEVLAEFSPDRATYIRDHAMMAAIAMAAGMILLWVFGNAHIWTGAVGGLAAIALRGWYVGSDELAQRWDLTNFRLLGPGGRTMGLGEIKSVNTLMTAVQVITQSGGKHLIKYQSDSKATKALIERARAGAQR